ncbi:MAG: hypothetical protein FJX76_18715 [Armatimonadetes bacterium]|nr:hypothetical protein [Armatimonadota bacterium]
MTFYLYPRLPARKTLDPETRWLLAALFLAFVVHFVLLFAMTVFSSRIKEEGYTFFTEVKMATPQDIKIVQVVAPKAPAPPPPPPKPVPPPPRPAMVAPQPPAPVSAAPAPAPAPRPVAVAPRPAAPPLGVPVVAAPNGTGPAIPVGVPGGVPGGQGDPNGGGQGGNGPGGNGPGGNGPGGPGGMAIRPGQGPFPSVCDTTWVNWQKLGIPQPPPTKNEAASNATTWEVLCPAIGVDINELNRRPYVEPYWTYQLFPDVSQIDLQGTNQRRVKLQVAIPTNGGRGQVTIVGRSGSDVCDSIAYKVAIDTFWLPARRMGQNEAATIEYELVFRE